MSQGDPPPVFTYEDYRAYLRDVYSQRKQRGLSHRGLARRAKLGSPSFLKAVMDGQKNLARATAARVASALGLAGDAAEYFSLLVLANQTTDAAERRSVRARLGRLRRYQDVRVLSDARDAYHRHWYLPAIRELASSDGFRADPRWIARILTPAISVRQAKDALSTLENLGLLRADEAGVLHAVDREVTTELEPNSEHIASYHRSMILGAVRAVTEVARAERDISSITLSVDAAGFGAMKRRLQEIRRELLDEFDAGKSGVQVMQVNFQLFPLSRRIDEEGASK